MSFNPVAAIRFTPFYAYLTGWSDHVGKVFAVLGFPTRHPTAREFVTAVRTWQHDHPPLEADGLLGAETWKRLLPEVQAYQGSVAAGARPDWVDTPPAARPGPRNVRPLLPGPPVRP